MTTVEVQIRGIAPLLQNNRLGSEEQIKGGDGRRRKTAGASNNTEEWKGKLYKDDQGKLVHPTSAIEKCLELSAREFKADKRRTMRDVIKACVFAEKPFARINKAVESPDFIHECPFVNPNTKGSGIRYRPAFKEGWTMDFKLNVMDEEAVPVERLKEIFDFGGARIGIGDWRPKYGRFLVSKFEFHNGNK